ncbi:fungal hydrophobin [Lentinus tigrinus ALCF2SS1-7]|uniref:Hydrophobin n=1 Tax=Lentinus tigrinus ALCF2SS1-6 TaxID=1328759 RepID=A0A5C2SPF0_9APHY|nr:fungal hydrophobin [Lentinus tigrinus ALCF2SS1-6]RPD79070.1 fungal hydrophobin [Lentinus tigrinus ALCF2SS1-7]
MFARTSATLSLISLLTLAVATPWNTPTTTPGTTVTVTITSTAPATTVTEPAGDCSTGPIQCCDSVEEASSPDASKFLGLLGIVVQGVDVLVGITCSPVTVIGVGGGSCGSSTAVCCEDNSFGGLVSIGCVPVIL